MEEPESHSYDVAGNLTSRSVPSSFRTTYTYDANNRMATVVADSLTTTYGYDVADMDGPRLSVRSL